MIINPKRNKVCGGRRFSENDQGKERSNKWCDGIICACSCGAKQSLCINIEKDAESVSDKADAENGGNAPKIFDLFSHAKADDHGTEAGENALEQHDLQRIL